MSRRRNRHVLQQLHVLHDGQPLEFLRRVARQQPQLRRKLRPAPDAEQQQRVILPFFPIRLQVAGGVHKIDQLAETARKAPQPVGPPVVPHRKQLRHQVPEGVGRGLGIARPVRFRLRDLPERAADGRRLLRVPRRGLLRTRREHSPGCGGGELFLVRPVVPAVFPGEQAVHGRRVGGEFRARPLLRPDRVAQAARSAASLLRLIERGEQQRQKRHIIRQRQRPGCAVIRIQRAAQAAVDAVVAQALRLCQPAEVGDHVSEHAHLSSGSGRSNSRWFKSAP